MTKYTLTLNFDTEDELREYLGGETRSAPAPAPAETKAAPVENNEPEITDDVDADGLPYDAEIHASPKSFTADGNWRSKRGKAKEANDARAAFKAAGGAVETPKAAGGGMPGMPAAAPAAEPEANEPVTYERMVDKTLGMMERGKIDADGVTALYAKIGLSDPTVLDTNESMRAKLFAELCAIEPEA